MSAPAASPPLRVALVCMPWCAVDRPSIQVGLLAAIAREHGFAADTHHLNVDLAARIPDAYDGLCSHSGHMTGEWLFGVAAFGEEGAGGGDEAYFSAFPEELERVALGGKDAAFLSSLRHEVLPAFVDECAEDGDWGGYDVVGFTSTFQQNVASLALARRIKTGWPEVRIVFGGANMEDEMGPEQARAFPWLDYVVVGEADRAFPGLLRSLAEGGDVQDVPGVVSRNGAGIRFRGPAPPLQQLDSLPVPAYDEFFERVERVGLSGHDRVAQVMPFESSRGCWWGQKHHCTFCGLNGLGMGFRSKGGDRVREELDELVRRHGRDFFSATDNILDMGYLRGLLGDIAEAREDYRFFYEIKANLSQLQIKALHDGGVRWVQPGIESLSSHVLALMNKGSTMLQNIRLLKWCRYYRIRVSWNLIWGFPGETAEDYEHELDVLKSIGHLEPPHACTRIWLERFSPYYFDRDHYPIADVHAEASYRYAYPQPQIDLDKLAYFFDYHMSDTLPDEAHTPTQTHITNWQHRHQHHPETLTYRRTTDTILIDDTRHNTPHGTTELTGPLAKTYEYCTPTMRTPAQIAAHLNGTHTPDDIRTTLNTLCQHRLMTTEQDRYLALALPTNPNW